MKYGVGINDADYQVSPRAGNKRITCPYYATWSGMLARCYSPVHLERRPTYVGCSVCEEWLTFSKFKAWMEVQDWEGKQLDKDLLIPGNKIYGPDTCVFVSRDLNMFVNDRAACRGNSPIGVSWYPRLGKFQASCKNPFTGVQEYLGLYDCPEDAHEAWRQRKHELACQYADAVHDKRLSTTLRNRYRLTEIDNAGRIRELESLLNSGGK